VTPHEAAREHQLERPGGAVIHWAERGHGPLVVLLPAVWSHPDIYSALVEDLAHDRRMITYDPRGCGSSTHAGPYDVSVDADDLEALLEAAGPAALAMGVGDGLNRGARVAARRANLIHGLVALAPSPAAILPRSELAGSEVIGASESVIDLLLKLLDTDPRTALRTMISAINPDLDEERLRDRVEAVSSYVAQEAGAARARGWVEDDVRSELRALGERLSIFYGGPDPLFEGALPKRFAELFPQARAQEIADGPVSRPDLTAALIRSLT
jgi:pimeloyl-ACP methyl ester carboxylesterase